MPFDLTLPDDPEVGITSGRISIDAVDQSLVGEIRNIDTAPGKPRVIIADTQKGKPISFMMKDAINWHAGHLDDKLYNKCMEELGL